MMHKAQLILAETLFPRGEYIHLSEVSNAPGFAKNRSADGIIISIWPSRGHHLIGIEVKVSRSDWLNELKKPSKADPFFKRCGEWYLVTMNDAVIAKPEEIPATWGHIHITGDGEKVRRMKHAPKNKTAKPMEPFIVSLLRNQQGDIRQIVQRQVEEKVRERLTDDAKQRTADAKELAELREKLSRYKQWDSFGEFMTNATKRLGLGYYDLLHPSENHSKIDKMVEGLKAFEVMDNVQFTLQRLDHFTKAIEEFRTALKPGETKP